MSDFSILTICAAVVASVFFIGSSVQDMFMRWTRSRNIVAHGWPPKHVDADGDPVAWSTEDEEA